MRTFHRQGRRGKGGTLFTERDIIHGGQYSLRHRSSEAAAFQSEKRKPGELQLEMDERKKELARKRKRKQRSSAAAKEIEKCKAKRRRHEKTVEARQQRLASLRSYNSSKRARASEAERQQRFMRMREEARCRREAEDDEEREHLYHNYLSLNSIYHNNYLIIIYLL